MNRLSIRTLGALSVHVGSGERALPTSKKTRALLAYLALTGRPQRRDRLCELFWEVPDDPRGSLRWSLSKIRGVVNDENVVRLNADRERVALDRSSIDIDLVDVAHALESVEPTHSELVAIFERLSEPLLEGLDLPDQPLYQRWLTAEREDVVRWRAEAARRLAQHGETAVDDRPRWCRAWIENDPFNPEAASARIAALRQVGRDGDAHQEAIGLVERFQTAGIAWHPEAPAEPSAPVAARSDERRLLSRQRIHFCTARDGVHIAYAEVGSGPPLVKAANWLNHLELDWAAPIWSPLFRELARDHTFIRYDERGCGLSDWDVDEISFETFVADLETVVEALGLERFPLLGISQGAAVSIEYAARHPGRVSHLILFGGYPAGWRIDASDETIREREAVMTLTETGWGQDNPAYRQIFSSTFMPSATADELNWFNDFQRQTTSPANAARFLSAFGDIDVRDRLAAVTVPTLVLHARGDQRIPLATGREIAATIPNAEFVMLDSDNHLLLGREPASAEFVDAVRRFID